MLVRQPKVIKITTTKWDDRLEKYSKGNIECKLQDREEGDTSMIVYLNNPFYVNNSEDLLTKAPLIAVTPASYKVIEWHE